MNRNYLASTALAFACGGIWAASSAGSAVAQSVATPSATQSAYDWTGAYVGLHAGYGWGREHDNLSGLGSAPPPPPPSVSVLADHFNLGGFVGGAHAGYSYQFPSSFVIGVEGDVDYTDLNGSHLFTVPAPGGRMKFNANWQASARLRAGYAIDNLLIYGTGGIAFAGGRVKVDGLSDDTTHVGWTAGAGLEYAFTQNWIGRFEVRYSDFNRKSYATPFGRARVGFNETTTTVGISYKF